MLIGRRYRLNLSTEQVAYAERVGGIELAGHGFVVGGPGSGKTTFLQLLVAVLALAVVRSLTDAFDLADELLDGVDAAVGQLLRGERSSRGDGLDGVQPGGLTLLLDTADGLRTQRHALG